MSPACISTSPGGTLKTPSLGEELCVSDTHTTRSFFRGAGPDMRNASAPDMPRGLGIYISGCLGAGLEVSCLNGLHIMIRHWWGEDVGCLGVRSLMMRVIGDHDGIGFVRDGVCISKTLAYTFATFLYGWSSFAGHQFEAIYGTTSTPTEATTSIAPCLKLEPWNLAFILRDLPKIHISLVHPLFLHNPLLRLPRQLLCLLRVLQCVQKGARLGHIRAPLESRPLRELRMPVLEVGEL